MVSSYIPIAATKQPQDPRRPPHWLYTSHLGRYDESVQIASIIALYKSQRDFDREVHPYDRREAVGRVHGITKVTAHHVTFSLLAWGGPENGWGLLKIHLKVPWEKTSTSIVRRIQHTIRCGLAFLSIPRDAQSHEDTKETREDENLPSYHRVSPEDTIIYTPYSQPFLHSLPPISKASLNERLASARRHQQQALAEPLPRRLNIIPRNTLSTNAITSHTTMDSREEEYGDEAGEDTDATSVSIYSTETFYFADPALLERVRRDTDDIESYSAMV